MNLCVCSTVDISLQQAISRQFSQHPAHRTLTAPWSTNIKNIYLTTERTEQVCMYICSYMLP